MTSISKLKQNRFSGIKINYVTLFGQYHCTADTEASAVYAVRRLALADALRRTREGCPSLFRYQTTLPAKQLLKYSNIDLLEHARSLSHSGAKRKA